MQKLKLFYPPDLFNEKLRSEWFELIKSKERFQRKKNEIDGNIQAAIEWVKSADLADVCILPLNWNIYYAKGLQQKALDWCNQMKSINKRVLSFTGGDQGITVPVPDNVIVYRQSGYRSTLKEYERTAPFFLSDPVTELKQATEDELFISKKNTKPIVGFCGMAPHGLKTSFKERFQILVRNAKQSVGISNYDKQAVLSSSNLRFTVLKVFKNSKSFNTNYVIRKKYRGGEQTAENRKKTTKEYYQNQIDSDLIICVRGVGNFSLRLYETLAMGRIPIFIDTDSPLPDIGSDNWHDHIIWVDKNELKRAPEIAMNWLNERDLIGQKKKNRALWIEQFRLDNYWLNQIALFKP